MAAGCEREHREVTKHLNWRGMARSPGPGAGGGFPSSSWSSSSRQQLNSREFADLKLPFAAVATDLMSGNPIALTEGSVARAVHASSAVPGVVVPVEVDGMMLSDGGVSDNLPVRTTRAMGADYVIAVQHPGPLLEQGAQPATRGALRPSRTRSAGRAAGLLLADCLIEPDISDVAYQSFSRRAVHDRPGTPGGRGEDPGDPEGAGTAAQVPTEVQEAVGEELEKAEEAA